MLIKFKVLNALPGSCYQEISVLHFYEVLLKKGLIICIHLKHLDPEFGLIHHILSCKSTIFLCMQTIKTLFFDRHYFAYRIEKENIYKTYELKDILSKYTSQINYNGLGDSYIIWDY